MGTVLLKTTKLVQFYLIAPRCLVVTMLKIFMENRRPLLNVIASKTRLELFILSWIQLSKRIFLSLKTSRIMTDNASNMKAAFKLSMIKEQESDEEFDEDYDPDLNDCPEFRDYIKSEDSCVLMEPENETLETGLRLFSNKKAQRTGFLNEVQLDQVVLPILSNLRCTMASKPWRSVLVTRGADNTLKKY